MSADDRRAETIDAYDVLHREPRRELVSLVELTARVCHTPMATINLITDREQHQIAAYGFDAAICRREDSMCARVLEEDTPVVVTDASRDPRFADNPFVTGALGQVRFYASHQLIAAGGIVIGTLCVFDEQPRTMTAEQVRGLGTLADRVVDVLELSLRNRQLASSNERLTAFAGRVSHDLKTPLTSLTLSLDMLQEQLLPSGADADAEEPARGEMAWLLDRALSGAGRMRTMIDRVLEYAATGAGIRAEVVDLEQLVDGVVADLQASLVDVDVTHGALPTVVGDAVQLRTVLQNLIENASKYREPGRPPEVTICAERRDDCWRISVADNGRGIPEHLRVRIFERGTRVEGDSGEAAAQGWGIGLDTCRRVVVAHGGRIAAEETPGGGATVWFELPV